MSNPTAAAEVRSWSDWAPALVLLVVSAIGILAGLLNPTGHHREYAVLVPPWYDFERTAGLVDAAGGDIVDFGGSPVLFIVQSDRPGFVHALYGAGAWLVIDAGRLGGCLTSERDPISVSQAHWCPNSTA